MEITIHRGTRQIGGCITEIKSNKGTRIIIDVGENLPSADGKLKPELQIEGLNTETPAFNAVFISHYHGDHIGMYNKINSKIPIYVGKISKEIYLILQKKLLKAKRTSEEDIKLIDNFRTFQIPEKIPIEDIIVTPIEVDHSAFNAHMFLIECDGKKVLHTGDFRTHGQRGKSVIPAIKKYVGEVDCLICEGTTLSRENGEVITEFELQKEAEKIFKNNKYNFVMCSSTNIDRIAAIHKAALKARKWFICDEYQKKLLMYIDEVSRSSLYKFKNKVYSYGDNLLERMTQKGFVMLVRENWESRKVLSKFPDSNFVYSQWEGYLDEKFKEYEHLQKFVPKKHISLHTSGHADFKSIKKVCEIVKPKILIPIHGENPEAFRKMNLENYTIKLIKDGEKIFI